MSTGTVRLVYFAWVRERIGKTDEKIVLPDGVETPADLMTHLSQTDEGYANAFADPSVVRVALDKRVAELDTRLSDTREVAFFPPMTGG